MTYVAVVGDPPLLAAGNVDRHNPPLAQVHAGVVDCEDIVECCAIPLQNRPVLGCCSDIYSNEG